MLRVVAVDGGRPFPVSLGGPPVGAVAAGALHVIVASGVAADDTWHVALDARGAPGPATPLGFVPLGACGLGSCVLATGLRRDNGRAVVHLLDARGQTIDQQALPVDGVPLRWPVPVGTQPGSARILWEAGAGQLEWVDWQGGRLGPKGALERPDRSTGLAAVSVGGELRLLRSHGPPSAAELLHLGADGRVLQRLPVAGPVLDQMAVAGAHIAVLMAEPQALHVAWFDAALSAEIGRDLLATVGPPHVIGSALLLPIGDECLLAGYSAAVPGEGIDPDRPMPLHRMVLYDLSRRTAAEFGPAEPLLAAAVLEDKLVVLSGARRARTSIYRIERD